MTYELKLGKFAGPLDELLSLIEARELDITEVSLAKVTDDFLRYLNALINADKDVGKRGYIGESQRGNQGKSAFDMQLVADFVSVASRLILIKSKVLLPDLTLTSEEEAGVAELERRLRIYRELRPAMRFLQKLWRAGENEYSRPYLLVKRGAGIFYPGRNLETQALFQALVRLFDIFEALKLETATVKEKIISIEEMIEKVVKRISREGEARFNNLSERRPRSEIIAIFLAILHLAREELVLLEQKTSFSDIIIKKPSL